MSRKQSIESLGADNTAPVINFPCQNYPIKILCDAGDDTFIPSCIRAFVHFPAFLAVVILYARNFGVNSTDCYMDSNLHIFLTLNILIYLVFWSARF